MTHSTTQQNSAATDVDEERRRKRLAYHREWMRRFRAEHPEKTREVNKRFAEKHRARLSSQRKSSYLQNREAVIAKACEYSRRNRDKINARNRARREADPERARQLRRASYLRCRDRDRQKRASRRSELAAYMRSKRNSDPSFLIADRLRRRINGAISKAHARKSGRLIEVSGCSLKDLVSHIERQFLDGMTWENRREWHIDHIVPLSAFDLTDQTQQSVAFHFTNLRPVWASDNLRKHARVPGGQMQLCWDIKHIAKAKKLVRHTRSG